MTTGDGIDIRRRLHAATAEARRLIIETLIADHHEGRLVLEGDAEGRINLRGISLGGARLRRASLAFADLHEAGLAGVNLSQANLRFAALEGAKLEAADLTEADLTGASMGEADLRGALLEDAVLEQAGLRFADLREAVLESARLGGADLWGARLEGADLREVKARGARLGETESAGIDLTRSDLREADFTNADLRGAKLGGADLRGAVLKGADLRDADLSGAQLQDLDLTTCRLDGARWSGAALDHTRIDQVQLGSVGEHRARESGAAARAYLALERNFIEIGDTGAGSWAYLRRRRMQKLAARDAAGAALRARAFGRAIREGAVFGGDQVVEWLCDYGESLPRVFVSIVTIFFIFLGFYAVVGGVMRVSAAPGAAHLTVTRDPLDLVVFSLMAMTTSGTASTTLVAANLYIALLTGLQALSGIFLTGLLGFVAGNRIRR